MRPRGHLQIVDIKFVITRQKRAVNPHVRCWNMKMLEKSLQL